jgi:transcriptional regulator with XRE-family HTH domain
VDWSAAYGVQSTTIANWMAGKSYPAPRFLVQLCDDTGLTVDWFYRGVMSGVVTAMVQPLKEAADSTPKKKVSAGRGRPKS